MLFWLDMEIHGPDFILGDIADVILYLASWNFCNFYLLLFGSFIDELCFFFIRPPIELSIISFFSSIVRWYSLIRKSMLH